MIEKLIPFAAYFILIFVAIYATIAIILLKDALNVLSK